MNIAPVSFRGMKEINAFANKQDKLTRKEQDLLDKAKVYHEIEVETTSDGDYCWESDIKKADQFATALRSFEKEPSKFAFLVGVDTLKNRSLAEASRIQTSVKAATITIGKNCPEVSKEDIIANLDILG